MDRTQADALNGAIRTLAIDHRALAAQALEPLGLHPGQEAVLFALERHGAQTQAGLAQLLGCEPPSITGMVRNLEAAKLVSRGRDDGDRRVRTVALTEDGIALMPDLWSAWCQLADLTIAQVTTAREVAAAVEALRTVAASVNHSRHRQARNQQQAPGQVVAPRD